jgi:exopolysaccharide biosynthesis polyprenyl glycosylphosphotransferase
MGISHPLLMFATGHIAPGALLFFAMSSKATLLFAVTSGVSVFAAVAALPRLHVVANFFRAPLESDNRRVLVIGTREEASCFLGSGQRRIDIIGALSDDHTNALYLDGDRLGGEEGGERVLADLLQSHAIDEVLISSPLRSLPPAAVALACVERGIVVRTLVKMPVVDFGQYSARVLGRGSYLLSVETVPNASLPLLVKRILDILGALVGLTLCVLTYCMYARRIKAQSRANVFFQQERVGKNGRLFRLYKFRTMYADAEQRLAELQGSNEMTGCVFKMRNDPRVTKVGRTLRRRYFDELPQFFNVLRGDMSLVGTRPPTPNEVARYLPYQRRRLSMKPGLTGLWQLSGNGKVNSFDQIVSLDCDYIDNWSLWLDLKILARTVLKVISGDGW